MKILTTEQIRAADAYTIEHEPVASIDLMERASSAFVEAFLRLPVEKLPVTVVCGQGNNGGDGLAIARLLASRNYQVSVWIIKMGSRYSPDCEANLKRWLEIDRVSEISSEDHIGELVPGSIVIDAIFGSGIRRGITGLPGAVIDYINAAAGLAVAVDMPSGLYAESPNPDGAIIEADYTLSFQAPKLGFFLPQNQKYVGNWQVLDIGLDQNFISTLPSQLFTIDVQFVRSFNRTRNRFAHKGNFGHALLAAGSKGKIGAAVLSAKAALRGGLGLLSVHVPGCGQQIMQTAVPEAMCQADENNELITDVPISEKITAVGLGPGMGTNQKTFKAIRDLLEQVSGPLVIDADGLNIISQHRECLELLPPGSILTPHPKEFQRLAGVAEDDYHRLKIQEEFSRKFQVIVVHKGAYTTVSFPEGHLYFNTTGNPGMASAGSGDVLTGLILGLLARTKDPALAALVGVYLHGLSGDLAAECQSDPSLIASDIIDHLGKAIKKTNLLL